MKAASFEFIEVFYNRKRQHSSLGYQSPIQYLQSWISDSIRENWPHRSYRMADEKPREAQSVTSVCIFIRVCKAEKSVAHFGYRLYRYC